MSTKLPVRVGITSSDLRLKSLLSSALKPEYLVVSGRDEDVLGESSTIDVLVIDLDSDASSLEEQLAAFEKARDPNIPVIVMTDDLRRSTAMEFLRRGAFDCIRKPPSLIEFKVIVGRAHEQALMRVELERARQAAAGCQGCDRLVGSSGRAQVVYDRIRRVADLSASVLITGESGTGKELVARAIHNTGNRAKHPFVAVSCGAIPESLIEAELFGHEKGAYTGSTGARAGYLEQAGEGTLFLDEIGELSLSTQVKLLRVLQQREFSRLGSNRLMPLNARVLFATHRNLSEMSDTGAFRKDLFYRVNVMNIHVPPLRERTEDIPQLALYFLKKYASEYDKPVLDIRPRAMEALVDYSWPGNIRELENVIQSAVIMTDGDCITPAELPPHIQQVEEDAEDAAPEFGGFEYSLRQFKINLINQTIMDCNGNKSLAARKLRVSRAYLHRLIRSGESENSAVDEAAPARVSRAAAGFSA